VLYTGVETLPGLLGTSRKDMRSWKEGDRTWYQISGPAAASWRPNLFVYEESAQGIEAMVRSVDGESAKLELARDFAANATVSGASPRATGSRISRSTC